MKKRPDQKLFEEVALAKGIAESFVEKDWFVTQIIAALAKVHVDGFNLIFTGGTALSKAHKLFKRFSEDVDFRVICSDELRSRKTLSSFKNHVLEKLKDDGFPVKDSQVTARDENRFFSVDLDYPSYFPRGIILRPHIQIEVAVRNTQMPPVSLSVASFVNELVNAPPEVTHVSCIDPVESAADKLSALTWRVPDRVRGDKYDDPAVVRHLHDLAVLKDVALANPNFPKLVTVSMTGDSNRPKTNQTFSGLSIQEKFALFLDTLDKDKEYGKEYDLFVKGVSYAEDGATPDFAAALHAVRLLIDAALKSRG